MSGNHLWNLGLGKVAPGRGMLLLGGRGDEELASAVVGVLGGQFPRACWYAIGLNGPGARVVDVTPPWPSALTRRNWLRRLRIQLVVVLPGGAVHLPLLHPASLVGAQIVCLDPPDDRIAGAADAILWCAAAIRESSGRRDATVFREPTVEAGLACLSTWLRGRLAIRGGRQEDGGRALPLLARWQQRRFRLLASVAALHDLLGGPETILCLGNGPSSEDLDPASTPFDALFRVNHAWRTRGRFTAPDVVFTAQRSSLVACGTHPVFCVQSNDALRKLLRRPWLRTGGRRLLNAEATGIVDPGAFGDYKPTNGAVMIAAAVALAPRRLIVAGIDLFSDPRGAYPDAGNAANAYTPAHDRDTEAGFLLATLRRFRGELIVHGETLQRLLAADGAAQETNVD
ncbi:MAG: hypothetical protein R3E84_19230 [Pseudomonadales bacterium]